MKKNIQKILSAVLIAATLFALCACGKSTSDPIPSVSSEAPAAEQAPAEKPEFVYVSDYNLLETGIGEYISVLCYTEDGVYGTISQKVGERELEEGETLEYEGQLDIYENRLVFVSYAGEVSFLEGYKQVPSPEAPEGEDVFDFWSGSYINDLTVSPEGKLVIKEIGYSGWNDVENLDWSKSDAEEHYHYGQNLYMRVLNKDGSEESSSVMALDENSYTPASVTDAEGNFFIVSSNTAKAVNPAGEEQYTLTTNNSFGDFYSLPDGRTAVIIYGDNGDEIHFIENGELSEDSIPMPFGAYYFFKGSGKYPLYYNNGLYLYGFDPLTGETEKIFNWFDCDVNPDSVASLYFKDDGSIVMMTNEYRNKTDDFDVALISIEQKPYDEVPHKTEITLGTQGIDWYSQDAIIRFNRKSDDCRIVVKDYSEYNTEDDYTAGFTKMKTEIMAGNCPDIIDMTNMPAAQMEAKGLIEDLYPFIDSDPELKREDFFENVLSAFEVNGKLVSTISSFSIDTVMGAAGIVGDTPGWTYSDLLAALEEMPEGCEPFDAGTTRDSILETCLSLDMDSFVNWSTGEVNFDNENFISLLEFANLFPEEYNWENYDSNVDGTDVRVKEGRQMLMNRYLYDFSSILYDTVEFGGDMTYIGYPTVNGTGSMIMPNSAGYALASSCADKETAWQFLRTFMMEEFQSSQSSFPISKSLYQDRRDTATQIDYEQTADGKYRLDENGERIPVIKFYFYDQEEQLHEVTCLTEEQAAKVDELVAQTTKKYNFDQSIIDIVKEQAAAFFAGQKTAAEAARLVQSKANIYVNEQR